MKVKFEFETPEQRKEVLTALAAGQLPPEATDEQLQQVEDATTDRILDGLMSQYVRSARISSRRQNRHGDPEKLKALFGK